jgi:catechol 2,3-dioxygenase-like lactoylglutathione lyase family enzyme
MSTQVKADTPHDIAAATTALRFEVTMLPVSDVDRAKAFYEGLGWRLDADFQLDERTRIVQFTPPQSPASIQFGTGITSMAGPLDHLYLVVDDIEAARAELIARGADVGEIWHGRGLGDEGHVDGTDPEHASYGSFATFADPDGNRYLLQEIKQRLPGRVWDTGIADLADRLLETSLRHDFFEKAAPPHHWWDWYAAYMDARQSGSDTPNAEAAADRYMAEVKGVVVPGGRAAS